MKLPAPKIPQIKVSRLRLLLLPLLLAALAIPVFLLFRTQNQNAALQTRITGLASEKDLLADSLSQVQKDLEALKAEDQFQRNDKLEADIKAIEDTYSQAVKVYEDLLDLKAKTAKTAPLDALFAESLSLLAKRNYASAASSLTNLKADIKKEADRLAAAVTIPAGVPASTTPPGSGYQRQKVATDMGEFMVSIISADLNDTRVIVDTASESDCANNCPTLPLADFVSRSGGFAGVNGSYFCPTEYPSCAGKTNSFDTLLMNKNKVYFNSANNVYSTVPAAIFYGNTFRFVGQSLEWGRDTGVDAVIANHPLLIQNGNLVFTSGGDSKQTSKGNRSFIGGSGNTVYIGVVHSATVAESAKVLHTLGIQNALNLDNGGSTALWSGGYKVGPGRNLANAVILVRK